MTVSCEEDFRRKIAALLAGAEPVIERLPASGNNRLYLVSLQKEKFIAKHYFTHAADRRNRLDAEFSFISFAFQNGIRCLPLPVARDDENNIGVYSFVEGRKPEGPDVTQKAVRAALDFLTEINKHRGKAGTSLPAASESCFSIASHIETIERRFQRLSEVADTRAKKFIREDLVPAWAKVKEELLSGAGLKKIRADRELPPEERIISPSDFGFHNALIGDAGRVYFLDFEYAGWDDPAKTVGDFFSQPALPVPVEHLEIFARAVAGLTPDPAATLARIDFLLRLYRIKWCCIALNHFLPTDSERRRFAGNDVDEAKEAQLGKAKKLLDSIADLNGVSHGLY